MKLDPTLPENKIDVEYVLRIYYPTFFNLLGDNKISWSSINKSYTSVWIKRFNNVKDENDSLPVEANFLDLIGRAMVSDMKYYNHIYFMSNLIKDLSEMLNDDEKKEVTKTVTALLSQPDKRYLNFIGEFAALWKFKNSGYNLFKTELPINDDDPSGKSIDFALTKDDKGYLVEVVNLHLDDDFHTLSDNEVVYHIARKIEEKKKSKEGEKIFWLCPVVWGEYQSLIRLYECVKKNLLSFERTFVFNAYISYERGKSEGRFQFGNIIKLIETPMYEHSFEPKEVI